MRKGILPYCITILRFGIFPHWKLRWNKAYWVHQPKPLKFAVVTMNIICHLLIYTKAAWEQPLMKWCDYKLALCLFKLYNTEFNELEFVGLNFNQILTGRQTNFISLKNNNLKVGINSLSNRFYLLNNKIPLRWFNHSIDTFKVYCKKLFLPK